MNSDTKQEQEKGKAKTWETAIADEVDMLKKRGFTFDEAMQIVVLAAGQRHSNPPVTWPPLVGR